MMNGELESKLLGLLEKIDGRLSLLEGKTTKETTKELYTPEEVAKQFGRKAYTVREWCRFSRIISKVDETGKRWIPASEVERLEREGIKLRPPVDPKQTAA